MLHIAVAGALLLYGIGHTVGFWMPVPPWFTFAWLLPGAAFVAGAWGFWSQATWWPVVAGGTAVVSVVLLLLQWSAVRAGGPFAAALAFNLLTLAALLLPWSRRLLVP